MLCRTNIGAMTQVMNHLTSGHRVALAGGGESRRALAGAARDLREGRPTWHPEPLLFASWGELQDYAEHDPAGGDLKPFVDLIDQHGPEAILAAVDQLTHETGADVTVSTAHRAKGREWNTVRIAPDSTSEACRGSTITPTGPHRTTPHARSEPTGRGGSRSPT